MTTKTLNNNYLIFSDLDGTLLDHESYSFEKAIPMLEYIKQNNIPLVLVTSKTKDEVLKLQKKLDLKAPFICENGAGIFIPDGENNFEILAMGKLYDEVVEKFNEYAKDFNIKGFSQLSINEVAELTGLSIEKAKEAKARYFTEPFILNDVFKFNELKKRAIEDGFDIVKGGRFYHLITLGQDKAKAILKLKEYYETKNDITYKTIALGDGQNDLSMLDVADQGILIKRYDGTFVGFFKDGLIKTKHRGPEGWNESLKAILCPQ